MYKYNALKLFNSSIFIQLISIKVITISIPGLLIIKDSVEGTREGPCRGSKAKEQEGEEVILKLFSTFQQT